MHTFTCGCGAQISGQTLREAGLTARQARWANFQLSGYRAKGGPPRCPDCRGARPRHALRRILDALEPEEVPSCTLLSKRLGVSRQAIEQTISAAIAANEWPAWACGVYHCTICGHGRPLNSVGMDARYELVNTGWRYRCHPAGYRCPQCLADARVPPTKRADWPHPESLCGKVLSWMESGRPYNAAQMAREFGVRRHNISRAKRYLYNRGKWPWPVETKQGRFDPDPNHYY